MLVFNKLIRYILLIDRENYDNVCADNKQDYDSDDEPDDTLSYLINSNIVGFTKTAFKNRYDTIIINISYQHKNHKYLYTLQNPHRLPYNQFYLYIYTLKETHRNYPPDYYNKILLCRIGYDLDPYGDQRELTFNYYDLNFAKILLK